MFFPPVFCVERIMKISDKKWRNMRHLNHYSEVPTLTPTVGLTFIELHPTLIKLRHTTKMSLFI